MQICSRYDWLIEMFVSVIGIFKCRCFCDWLIEMLVFFSRLAYLNVCIFVIGSFKCLSFCDCLIEMFESVIGIFKCL